jgi:hypothetical protein
MVNRFIISIEIGVEFCSYILFTIDDITSCMYCGIHVGAPGLFLKPGVTEVVETWGKTIGCELS